MEERIFSISKERYDFEIERQFRIRSNISITISFCALVITGLFFIFNNLYALNNDFYSMSCYVLISVLYLLILISAYFFLRSIIGYGYGMLPPPSKTIEDIDKLKNYYDSDKFKDKTSEEKKLLVNSHLTKFFKEYYIEATEINIKNNNKRSNYLYLAQATLTIAIIVLLLILPPFSIKLVNYQKNISRNKESISMPNDEKKPESNQVEKDPASTNVTDAPTKTPLDIVKESEDKPMERKDKK